MTIPVAPKPATLEAPAWLALGFGILGLITAPIPNVNALTAVMAVTGLVCGIIGLTGTRKFIAAVGAVLSTVAIVAALIAHQVHSDAVANSQAMKALNTPQVSPSAEDFGISSSAPAPTESMPQETEQVEPVPESTEPLPEDGNYYTPPAEPQNYRTTVTYEIISDSGASSVTYTVDGLNMSQEANVGPTWSKTLDMADSSYTSVLAQNAGGGTITCRISIDGGIVLENSSHGLYTVVTCSH